jgi:hypothetical protein
LLSEGLVELAAEGFVDQNVGDDAGRDGNDDMATCAKRKPMVADDWPQTAPVTAMRKKIRAAKRIAMDLICFSINI